MAERQRRSVEERIAELDKKIAFHQEKIDVLEAKKKGLMEPKISASQIISKAKENGMSTADILKKLGISV